MEILLLLILASFAAVLIILIRLRSRSAAGAPSASSPPRDPLDVTTDTQGDPRDLKVGDMVDLDGRRAWIRGSLRMAEGGYTWVSHFLDGDGEKCWLSVEANPEVELALWTARPELDLSASPRTQELEGVTYRLVERGTASYRSEGTTGLPAHGGADYVDYASADGRKLALERYDHGKWEASVGSTLSPGSLTIYPGG